MTDDIFDDIRTIKPDIIGLSCTSRYFLRFSALAQDLREQFKVPIIWGGVHITIAPRELPESADVGVLGEGEETLKELLENFHDNKFNNLGIIRGIVYLSDKTLIINPKRQYIEPLDTVPPPDLSLFRISWSETHRGVILTSRGCPYKCRFCASSIFWDRTRLHSAEYVVKEIKELVSRYHVQEILIYDDFFSIDKKRVAKIVELKKKEPLLDNLKFECLSRVDNFDDAMASLLKELGVYRISFGIESGCQKTLDYLKNKKIKLEQIVKAIEISRKYGFQNVGSVVIGSPYESIEDIRETFDFILKLRLNSVQITIATPFPGTELWEDGKTIGKITGDGWSDDYYVLFGVGPDTNIKELLKGKRLMTQIDTDEFIGVAEKAVKIQNRINFGFKQLLRERVRKILILYGFGFMLRWRKQLLAKIKK
jgi:radical SAM superfamily enzyme YgiQ (UPF0313 family)